jgi:hypothetical protein
VDQQQRFFAWCKGRACKDAVPEQRAEAAGIDPTFQCRRYGQLRSGVQSGDAVDTTEP